MLQRATKFVSNAYVISVLMLLIFRVGSVTLLFITKARAL